MSVSILLHITITNAYITVGYEFGVWLPHTKNTTKSTTKSRLSATDSEESTTMKLDIESQFETEIMAESGQNGE